MFSSGLRLGYDYEQHQKELGILMNHAARVCRSRFDGCKWFMKCSVLGGLVCLIYSLGYG